MPVLAAVVPVDAATLAGWLLVVVGLMLAVETLGEVGWPWRPIGLLASTQAWLEWPRRRLSLMPTGAGRARSIDSAAEIQRLRAIIVASFAKTDLVVGLHAAAAERLEAADDALLQLLADWGRTPTIHVLRPALARPDPVAAPALAA
ncbi:MAG: hypothetical protein AB7O44_17805 [Hyphomicrobiaceae bacterium]